MMLGEMVRQEMLESAAEALYKRFADIVDLVAHYSQPGAPDDAVVYNDAAERVVDVVVFSLERHLAGGEWRFELSTFDFDLESAAVRDAAYSAAERILMDMLSEKDL